MSRFSSSLGSFSENKEVPFFGGPCGKDPTVWGTILGSPIFGTLHFAGQSTTRSSHPRTLRGEGSAAEAQRRHSSDLKQLCLNLQEPLSTGAASDRRDL